MSVCFRLLVRQGNGAADFEGWGCDGRRYAVRQSGGRFAACLIAGPGQPITATGRTPLEALRRAETAQLALAPKLVVSLAAETCAAETFC